MDNSDEEKKQTLSEHLDPWDLLVQHLNLSHIVHLIVAENSTCKNSFTVGPVSGSC